MIANPVNPWDHRLSLESQPLKTQSKVLSHQHFRSSLLCSLKNWTPNKIFYESSETSQNIPKNICQKYYGKKITFLSSKRDITRVLSLRKVLKSVKINDMKFYKIKSQNDLIMLVDAVNWTKKELKKLLREFRGRIEITDWTQFNLSRAIPDVMRNLNQLHLDIFKPEEFHTKNSVFSKLKDLQKLYFYCENGNAGEEEEIFNQKLSVNVLKDIVKSKHLEILTWEFLGKINHETLFNMLKLLSTSNITSWYLDACLTVNDFHWIDEMKLFLASVDSLALDSEYLGRFEGEVVEGHKCNFLPKFENRGRDQNKVLRIFYEQESDEDKDNSKTVDISKYLAYCTNLKSLFIRSVGGKLGSPGQIDFPVALRDVIISFNNIYCPGYRNCDQSVLRFLLVGLGKLDSLRSLKLFHGRSDYSVPTSMDEEGKSEQIMLLGDEIKRIAKTNLLEELQIFDSGVFVHPIREILQSTKNLKKLDLVLTGPVDRRKYWDEDFPFESISGIEEFSISINYDVDLYQIWGFGLIRSLGEMKQLRVLKINDRTKRGFKLEVIYGLLNALCRVEKLEKLYIRTEISKDAEREKLNELLSVEVRKMISDTTDRIFQDIRNAIQKMRNKCPKLEEIRIARFLGFPFESIQYNKYRSDEE